MAELEYQEALDAVKELAGLVGRFPERRARIIKMLDDGSGLFDVKVDGAETVATGERVVVYKPSDRLLGILAANRTVDGEPDDVA